MACWYKPWTWGRTDPLADSLRRANVALQEAELKLRTKLVETASLYSMDNFVDPREVLYDDPSFYPYAAGEHLPTNLDNRKRGEVLPVYLTEFGLKAVRDQSRRQLQFNEFAINAVETRIAYIVGCGLQYKVVRKDDDPLTPENEAGQPDELCEQAQAILDGFKAHADWGEAEQEIVRRCDRDGEAFLRFFPDGMGRVAVRFVEPEHVKSPHGEGDPASSFGVQTDPEDIEDVRGYWIVEDPANDTRPTLVDAEEVLHFKLNVDRSAKRGLPTLLPVRKNLERAEKLLRNMSTLAQIQATFALIRKHKTFSASAVSTFQTAQQDVQHSDPYTGRTRYTQQLQPGTIIDAPDNTEYEFPSAGVAASEYVAILQAELRAVASRLGMPEYMLTADASNANYSSTLVAEAPAVRNFERWQDFYARKFGRGGYRPGRNCGVMWRVLKAAVEGGILPAEVFTHCELQVEGPSLAVRNKTEDTSRRKLLNEGGILSKRTWATEEGYDFDRESKQIEAEPKDQQGGDPLGGLFGGGGGGDDEDSDLFGGGEGDDPFDDGQPPAREDATEGVERNKTGRGCHDTETGKPAPCPGSGKGGVRQKKGADPYHEARKESRKAALRPVIGQLKAIEKQWKEVTAGLEGHDGVRSAKIKLWASNWDWDTSDALLRTRIVNLQDFSQAALELHRESSGLSPEQRAVMLAIHRATVPPLRALSAEYAKVRRLQDQLDDIQSVGPGLPDGPEFEALSAELERLNELDTDRVRPEHLRRVARAAARVAASTNDAEVLEPVRKAAKASLTLARRLEAQEAVKPRSKPSLGELAKAVSELLADCYRAAGEEAPDLDAGKLQKTLAHILGQNVSEACVQNKSGQGYHDDKTGYPCTPGGGAVGAAGRLFTAVAGKLSRIVRAAPGAIGGAAKAVAAKVATKAKAKFKQWEQQFGRKGAIAVLAATVAMTPVPLPGTSLAPVLIAHAVKAVVGKLRKQPPAREVGEACVPNKTGKGHHDDRTGHPCNPGGHDDGKGQRVRREKSGDPRAVSRAVATLNSRGYTDPSDRLEAATSALLGHEWSPKRPGYDSHERLDRWLGEAAGRHGNPIMLVDVKGTKGKARYADRADARLSKAQEYQAARDRGLPALNAIVFSDGDGIYLHLGIDHQSGTPAFGPGTLRPIVDDPAELAKKIDGSGGILPAIRLSSKIRRDPETGGLAGADPKAVAEFHAKVKATLEHLLSEVGMDTLQKQLDAMSKQAQRKHGAQAWKSREVAIGLLMAAGMEEKEAAEFYDARQKKDTGS